MKKRILALLMVLAITISMIPATVLATTDEYSRYHNGLFDHHWYPTWFETTPATCTTPGEATQYCVFWWICGGSRTKEIPTNDVHFDGCAHDQCEHLSGDTYTSTYESTCKLEGYRNTYCKDCDALLSTETLPTNDNHAF